MGLCVFAIAAHPDDIEFGMAGTLLLLSEAGCEIHYMNIANGSCGSAVLDTDSIISIRLNEASQAAKKIGAIFHPPIVPDLEIFYQKELIAKLGSIIRKTAPDILLIPSPDDYMEDHMNACRLAVSGAFIRGMPNCVVEPPEDPIDKPITLYHAQPHGNRNYMNQLVMPELYVDISGVIDKKTDILAMHKSQKDWLDRSQGFDSYLNTMKEYNQEMGELSGRFRFAEGWRFHNPLGFCSRDSNPLAHILKDNILLE